MATKWLDSALRRQKVDTDNGEKSEAAYVQDQRALGDVDMESELVDGEGLKSLLELQRRSRQAVDTVVEPPKPEIRESSFTIQSPVVEADQSLEAKPAVPVASPAPAQPASSQGDLMPVEDIYRAAGVLSPRMGYSINKVADMMSSDHMRGLSNETKRAALLMALDAAGISVEEVLRDAVNRRKALDAYEADQRKLFEENWARKAEANDEIQSEMGRLTSQYLERIKRNLDEVTLEKAALAQWQATKQQEAQRISEAVALCSKEGAPAESDESSLSAQGKAWGPSSKRRKPTPDRGERPD